MKNKDIYYISFGSTDTRTSIEIVINNCPEYFISVDKLVALVRIGGGAVSYSLIDKTPNSKIGYLKEDILNTIKNHNITNHKNKIYLGPPYTYHINDTLQGIQDGGERISYGEGKAVREPSDGKGRYDLISPFALMRIAKWYELGAKKYSDRNWEKGIPFSRYYDSAMRHLNKFMMGMTDEDHLAAAAWNVMAMIHHQELGQNDLDDLPHYFLGYSPTLKEGMNGFYPGEFPTNSEPECAGGDEDGSSEN